MDKLLGMDKYNFEIIFGEEANFTLQMQSVLRQREAEKSRIVENITYAPKDTPVQRCRKRYDDAKRYWKDAKRDGNYGLIAKWAKRTDDLREVWREAKDLQRQLSSAQGNLKRYFKSGNNGRIMKWAGIVEKFRLELDKL